MSAIRHFDVPHIVRFGRTDDIKCTTWMRFYRNATCFEVSIHQADIVGTAFEEQWRQYLPPPSREPPGGWVHRWDSFCDLVISQILPKLKELAPTGHRSWITFEDYLSTPTYHLSIHKPAEGSDQRDAVAVVDSGPTPAPAFSFYPQPMSDLDIPQDVRSFEASELKLVQPKNLRQEPHKVLMPDGTLTFLVPAKKPLTRMPEEIVIHPSMTTIRLHLLLHKLFTSTDISNERLACFSDILGIVTTSATADSDAKTETQSTSTTRLAGMLLAYLPHAQTLADPEIISIIARSSNPDDLRQKWHAILSEAVRTLHTNSTIVHGNINPHTILMYRTGQDSNDSKDDPETIQLCLAHFSNELSSNVFIEPVNRGTKEADLQGLENTFGDHGWLVHEIKKLKGEIDKDSQWRMQPAS